MLQQFISENFWYLSDDVFLKSFDTSFAANTSRRTKTQLADVLAASAIFVPRNDLTILPLVPIRVEADFDSEPFFLVAPKSLPEHLPATIERQRIVPNEFPPITEAGGKAEYPSAWLGVRSPALRASLKMRTIVLGSLALTPLPQHRHSFSGRSMFGGYCTFADTATVSFGEAHTPAMMHDIIIATGDHAWLHIISAKLLATDRKTRGQLRALEYFYRAWPLDPSERFPWLCMTLDAAFGEASHATQAVIDGIRATIGDHIQDARLRQLMDLRASVIHGGAPDVYDSRKYARYYDNYDADPIRDLELIVGRCLRTAIFDGALHEHADPIAHHIAAAQARGIAPIEREKTILD